MSLEQRFKKAVWLVRNGPPANSSNETKLKFYAHFKQATEGDNTAEAPYRVQFEARAKWEAWEALKGMSKQEAMQIYIDLVAAGEERVLQKRECRGAMAAAGMFPEAMPARRSPMCCLKNAGAQRLLQVTKPGRAILP